MLIKLYGKKIFYSEERFVELSQTNLPSEHMTFKFRPDVYWEVEIEEYDEASGSLKMKVVNYNPGSVSKFSKQNLRINNIQFSEKFYWKKLETYLGSYRENRLGSILKEPPKEEKTTEKKVNTSAPLKSKKFGFKEILQDDPFEEDPEPISPYFIQETFKYPFSELEFHLGFVTFLKKFKDYPREIEIRIDNPFILPEFKYIKGYFPRAFNSRKVFTVKVNIEILGLEIKKIIAESPEIEAINGEIITTIKKSRAAKVKDIDLELPDDQKLFTADELQAKIDDSGSENTILHVKEDELIDAILELADVRNRDHLHYLASQKHNLKERIRFTIKPYFGFLFFIEGEDMNHFCWELLDSHATYLWSFEKQQQTAKHIKEVGSCISLIWEIGREKFKRAYREKKLDGEFRFESIHHKTTEDGFLRWKVSLDQYLS
jgi:hypothetical protein